MRLKKLEVEIEIPNGVDVAITEKGLITAKGPKGENKRVLFNPMVKVEKKENKIIVSAVKATKREKRTIGTFSSHIRNIIKGTTEKFVYKLKVCSGHFPMTVTTTKTEFNVKNFLGESIPRIAKLRQGVDVKIEGDIVVVESCDKELAGQTAADIEQLTRISNRDKRIFQDGIWLIERFGKHI